MSLTGVRHPVGPVVSVRMHALKVAPIVVAVEGDALMDKALPPQHARHIEDLDLLRRSFREAVQGIRAPVPVGLEPLELLGAVPERQLGKVVEVLHAFCHWSGHVGDGDRRRAAF